MQDRPTIQELLTAVQRFLDDEIVPSTTGRRQFLARVAANVVRQVDRELLREEEHDRRAWTGLDGLLGTEPMPDRRDGRRAALSKRLERLCEGIRSGELDSGSAQLLSFLRASVRDKLEVTNPALLAADGARGEIPSRE